MTNYLKFVYEDKLDKLPEWILFKGWNTKILENINEYDDDGYAFELYY